jgi:hypothetical protein
VLKHPLFLTGGTEGVLLHVTSGLQMRTMEIARRKDSRLWLTKKNGKSSLWRSERAEEGDGLRGDVSRSGANRDEGGENSQPCTRSEVKEKRTKSPECREQR